MTDFKAQFREAWHARVKGEYDKALALAEQSLQKADQQSDKAAMAMFLKIYAQVHSDKDELEESLRYYKQIEDLYIELGDSTSQMHTLRHIGSAYQELGKTECAEKCLKQVVDHYKINETNTLEKANTHRVYAITMEAMERNEEAISYWEMAKGGYSQLDITEGVLECDEHLQGLYKQV